ncbi:hypothetical protein C8R43DRAFT_398253 [Mycena crocata]|nr:hypothetical protein C8R43DRAFT_398253 [Mycena crocata]
MPIMISQRDGQPHFFFCRVVSASHPSVFTTMSAFTSFARLLQVCWSFFLALFPSRRRKHPSSPELPTSSANHDRECDTSDVLGSWQNDKQQFLRRPSLARASVLLEKRTREIRKKKHRALAPPPPEIYIQDWSSMRVNMTDLFESPSSVASRSVAVGSGPLTSVELATISEHPSPPSSKHSEDECMTSSGLLSSHSNDVSVVVATDALDIPETPHFNPETESSIQLEEAHENGVTVEIAPLSFSTGGYASNASSAVSEPFWDPPASPISHSIPLPDAASALFMLRRQSVSTVQASRRDSLVPYPDLFDFNMYTQRVSRDSLGEAFELPLLGFGVNKCSDKTSITGARRPISIYDVTQERDRYRNAAYSSCLSSGSPIRPPFTSTLNLESSRKLATEDSFSGEEETTNSVGAQFIQACDRLSRCEWTDEEFMRMFTSSVNA